MRDVCRRCFLFVRATVGVFIEVVFVDTCLGLLVWICAERGQQAKLRDRR